MPDKPIAFSLYDESYVLHKFGCLKETEEKTRVTIIQMDSSNGPELSLLFKSWPLYALLGNVLWLFVTKNYKQKTITTSLNSNKLLL